MSCSGGHIAAMRGTYANSGLVSRARQKNWGAEPLSPASPLPYTEHKLAANRDVATAQQLNSPAARDQVNDRNNQSDHQQQMDQAAGHMESPAQKPEDDEDCKDRPKHKYPLKSEGYIDCHQKVRGSFSGRSCP